jgi:hypothetical protein
MSATKTVFEGRNNINHAAVVSRAHGDLQPLASILGFCLHPLRGVTDELFDLAGAIRAVLRVGIEVPAPASVAELPSSAFRICWTASAEWVRIAPQEAGFALSSMA